MSQKNPKETAGGHVKGLDAFLRERGLYFDRDVIKVIENELNDNNGRMKVFLLTGPAGTGKTSLAEAIADYLDANEIFYQATLNTSEDDLLYRFVPSEQSKSGIRLTLGPLPRAVLSSKKQKTVLIIDEFDKTRPSTDAVLLDFLQNGRLSLYLNDKKTVMRANPDNLIVFLTSNNFRELSEPLARRVIRLDFEPLQTATVYKLMLDKFHNDKLALLLTQIYDDTLQAGLQKPATVQELYQLGNIIQKMEARNENYNLSGLLKMYILKYPEDEQKFYRYVSDREPYAFIKEIKNAKKKREDDQNDIINAYVPANEIVDEGQDEQNQQESTEEPKESLLQALESKIKINKKKIEQAQSFLADQPEIKEDLEVTAKIEATPKNYSDVAKHYYNRTGQIPETPENLYHFGITLDIDKKPYLITQNPLRLGDMIWAKAPGEYYFEDDDVLIPEKKFNELMDMATVYPFSKKITQIISETGTEAKEIINLENIKELDVFGKKFYLAKNFRAYLKNDGKISTSKFKMKSLADMRLGSEVYQDLVYRIINNIFDVNKNTIDVEKLKKVLNNEDLVNLRIPTSLKLVIFIHKYEGTSTIDNLEGSHIAVSLKYLERGHGVTLFEGNVKGLTIGQVVNLLVKASEEYNKMAQEMNQAKDKKQTLTA